MTWEVAVSLGLVGVAFAVFYLGNSLKDDHYALKLLFLFVGLFMCLTTLGAMPTMISANIGSIGSATADQLISTVSGAYNGFLWITILVVAYFLIYFIYKLTKGIGFNKNPSQ